jgi:hypothetical protein
MSSRSWNPEATPLTPCFALAPRLDLLHHARDDVGQPLEAAGVIVLGDREHRLLRPVDQDARVFVGVVCACAITFVAA